jgi:hypothetical protein
MNHWELTGTLTITTVVVRGDNEKRVALATIPGVLRDECGEQIEQFCTANPHLRDGMLFAEWVAREHIRVPRSCRPA